jgi:hypothetical protein
MSIELNFKEWLLMEMPHLALRPSMKITLPDARGFPVSLTIAYIDPKFEIYHPQGEYRDPNTQELINIPWERLVMNNGTGWEGRLPFARNQFFVYKPGASYGMISPSQGLPRVPDDWYTEAEFADREGQVVYHVKEGIFNTSDPRVTI